MEEFPKHKPKVEKGPETPEERYRRCLEQVTRMVEQGASEQERIDAIRCWQDVERQLDESEKLKPENRGKPRRRKDEIRDTVRIAEVKHAAGFQDAMGDFYDAIDEATQCGEDDLAQDIRNRMKELYPEIE